MMELEMLLLVLHPPFQHLLKCRRSPLKMKLLSTEHHRGLKGLLAERVGQLLDHVGEGR
jgi:hypothetical protein